MRDCLVSPVLLTGLFALSAGVSADWPGWRGPGADGVADGCSLPVRWSKTENVR